MRFGGAPTDEFDARARVQAIRRRTLDMRRSLVLVGALTMTTIALGASTEARADEGVHVDASLSGFTSPTFVDRSMHVGTGDDGIDMLSKNDVRLVGNGAFDGAALHATARIDRLRIGFEEAVLVGSGFDVKSGTLPDGFSVTNGTIWGGRFELSLGRELVSSDASKDAIAPYVDLRVGLSFVTSNLQLHSVQWGALGSTSYTLVTFLLAPRVGARIPLGENTFVDVNGSYAIFGLERATFSAGLGVQF
jgi:hypothetical protein